MVRYTLETYTKTKYEQDRDLIDEVESGFPIDFKDPERHIENKRNILKNILGYKNLRIGSNKSKIKFCSLDECNPGRITRALKERYESALKRVKKFGDPPKIHETQERYLKKIKPMKQLSLFR